MGLDEPAMLVLAGANGLLVWAPEAPLIEVVVTTPPLPVRTEPLVCPLMKTYEYIGLTSKPLNGVISGLMMIAKLSPRVCGWQEVCALPEVVHRWLLPRPALPAMRKGGKSGLPVRFSSIAA